MTEAALIQGIELHARTLVPYKEVAKGEERNTFLVGTQSLRSENHIHRLTYDDDNANSLQKKSYPHRLGEIWHLAAQPETTLVASCFNRVTNDGDSCASGAAIFRMEDESLECLYEVQPPENVGSEVRQIQFQPMAAANGRCFAALVDCQAVFYDVDSQKVMQSTNIEAKNTLKTFAFSFNPPGNLLALNSDSTLRGVDVRSMVECWTVTNAHMNQIRSLDFNPNRSNVLATAGDDCAVKFWDLRNLERPVVSMRNHSHWVWSVRFNPCYDQLVLTGSSDSKVHLLRVASVCSDEVEAEVEQDADDEVKSRNSNVKGEPKDVLLETFDDHEDSIYCTEWAPCDPFIFASISYDGRLVINRVPKEEKFRILC
ncbi:protein TSSC1-like [Tropilaelaps mercedesae]|uniref:Protein TSSC1-like n=1 Tax=Tropilaelaps mercedesae TaxID=418985 RepID=A0A1V9XSC3_9ACAR|nr:protein TSSC1-like [Tropilaelaps mercedesae]